MARTNTKKDVAEETVMEEVIVETTEETVEEKAPEMETVQNEQPKKPRAVIAKSIAPLRSRISLQSKYIIGQMKIGTAYEIEKEISTTIYGDFYLLKNGYYITKDGNYTLI